MLQIEPRNPIPQNRNALLFLGFRPFFLLAGIASLLLIGLWLPLYFGLLTLNTHFSPVLWHGHEMLYGFAVAVIAGFLLTAVRNWTGLPTPTGWKLGLLVLIWLSGRLLIAIDLGQPCWLTAAADLAFLPAVMIALAAPLIRAGKPRNMVFLLILAALTGANLLMHQQALAEGAHGEQGLRAALTLVVLVIVIMGGRVIPFFTRNPLPGMQPRIYPWLELVAISAVILVSLSELAGLTGTMPALLALLAGGAHLARLAGWYDARIWRMPILWVLHVAYAWIGLGFLLKGGALLGFLPATAPTHAFAVGGIGMITLGMMGRVALGHTGRELRLPKATVIAIRVLAVSALLRLSAALFSEWSATLLWLAAGGWCFAFAAFVWNYAPILMRPRIDGRPG